MGTETTSRQDSELLSRLARNLDEAFPDLVLALQDDIYSGALRLSPNRADAEDVTQEAFVRAYRALAGYEGKRIRQMRLRPWLWTIALNLCRNRARAKSRKPQILTLIPSDEMREHSQGPEDEMLAGEADSEWQVRLDRLPGPMRTAVVLRHVVGLSYQEIATTVGRPVGTVKADVHRGLGRLRKMIETREERHAS